MERERERKVVRYLLFTTIITISVYDLSSIRNIHGAAFRIVQRFRYSVTIFMIFRNLRIYVTLNPLDVCRFHKIIFVRLVIRVHQNYHDRNDVYDCERECFRRDTLILILLVESLTVRHSIIFVAVSHILPSINFVISFNYTRRARARALPLPLRYINRRP